MIRVFVSSVSKRLAPARQQLIADLHTAGYDVSAMEHFGARGQAPLDVCLREVCKSDVVVLIIGPRYGSLLPQGISYTHAEYREAIGRGLPVLVFQIPNDPGLDTEEAARLSTFLAEAGSATTYDSLAPDEELSGKVFAALTAAQNRGELGSRYSIFQTFDRYFAQQLGTRPSLFKHDGPFLGRDEELSHLSTFVRGTEPVVLLKAPGGVGKSRLLLEAAKATASEGDTPHIFFADAAGQWGPEDISRLPLSSLILILDDAHRRADLDRLISACLQHNDETRFIVSCRPSAVSIVIPHVASLTAAGTVNEITLNPLTSEDATALAQHHLGNQLAHLAPRLVTLADQNPLVISVGARCIAQNRVPPEMLERSPEAFRALVLDRLLDDPGLTQTEIESRRNILETVAAVGPVITESDEFLDKLNKLVGDRVDHLRRNLAALERASFLVRRGRLVRVGPDVLSDHLLYRAAVDEMGRPTGFIDKVVDIFSPDLLENVLANAAELDWRAASSANHESVLASTWRNLLTTLPAATNPQRAHLVQQLKRSAVFAPEEVMSIAVWLAEHPEAPPDESNAAWGLDTPDRVIDALTDTFALIATHPDFTRECVKWLWTFAANDERPTNSNPTHPHRRLVNLLKYEWTSDWRDPDGVHARVVRFVIDRLKEPRTTDDLRWAIGVLGTALQRLGEANETTRRTFTFGQFSLASDLPNIEARRQDIVACLKDLCLGPQPLESAAALYEITGLLRIPRGLHGEELTAEEIVVWQPEAERAISILVETSESAPLEVIRFLARRSLREISRGQWPAIASALDNALTCAPVVASEPLYDLLVGLPREEPLDGYEAEQDRVGQLCSSAAEVLWNDHKTAQAVVATLIEGIATIESLSLRGDSHTGLVVRSLVAAMPEEGESLVRSLAAADVRGWQLLRPALLALHESSPATAMSLVSEMTTSDAELLRACAADPLQWMADHESTWTDALGIVRRLSRDAARIVRKVVAPVLRAFRTRAPIDALAILTDLEWDNDIGIANAVLDVLHPNYGIDPNALPDSDIDKLLSRIEDLQRLEGRSYDLLQFLTFACQRRPRQTVEMLLRRVHAVDEHLGERGEDRWTPIPYNAHGLSLAAVSQSSEYQALLRLVRDAYLEASDLVRFWLPTLFHALITDLSIALDVLREWFDHGNQERIVGAAHFLQGFDHSFVFTQHVFIADLLEVATSRGNECLKRTRSKLFATAISGGHSGTPGQPAPRYLDDRESANELRHQYSDRSPARDFYGALVRHAEHRIEQDRLEWEEEGDD